MPHNGLANSPRPLPIARIQSDTSLAGVPSRAEIECSSQPHAPLYAPGHKHRASKQNGEILTSERTQQCASGIFNPSLYRGVLESRSPKALKLHPSLARLSLASAMADLNELAQQNDTIVCEHLSVTTENIILNGFDLWRLAMQRNIEQVPCFVYALTQDDALRWLLQNNTSRHSFWNKYCRIVLALELEEDLLQQALANQRAGGREKGLLNLSKAERMHVRSELAKLARVSPAYVDRVKLLRTTAEPKILQALQRGQISINRAWTWRNLSFPLQAAALSQFLDDRETKELTRSFFRKPRPKTQRLDPTPTLRVLMSLSLNRPDAVRVYFRHVSGRIVITLDEMLDKGVLQGELSLA